MTDAEIFDQQVDRFGLGGRLVHNCDQEMCAYKHIRLIAETLISSARHLLPTLPPIHFDFIKNSDVNAFAFKADGRYFIGVNYGTVYLLELLLTRMLADPRLFEMIGNPAEEDSNLPPLTEYTPQADKMHNAGHTATSPKTLPRQSYAAELFYSAIRFIVGHEIAHITFGHVDYIQTKNGTALVAESEWQKGGSPAQASFERQCIESQADMRSIHSAVETLKLHHRHYQVQIPLWYDSPPSERFLIFSWAFSMNTFFRLFGDIRFKPTELQDKKYPPISLRRVMATNTAYALIASNWNIGLKQEALHSLQTAMKYSEYAFSIILDEKISTEGLADAYAPASHSYVKELIDYTSELQQKLTPYSFE